MRSAGGGPLVAADLGVSVLRCLGVSGLRCLGVSSPTARDARSPPRRGVPGRDYDSRTFRPAGSPNDAAPVAGSRS
ncbi:hypothetical protein DVK07_04745 [Halorubrum sp. Atlit-26R]|nr:hypothetical protein DVK07_04745 [Halorubrum sp. Atlit-26R]